MFALAAKLMLRSGKCTNTCWQLMKANKVDIEAPIVMLTMKFPIEALFTDDFADSVAFAKTAAAGVDGS
jgi:hypothetical protein